MPSVAQKAYSYDDLSSYFPLTYPIPHPKTHPDLITVKDLNREEDLLRNPSSFRAWWSAIQSTRDSFTAATQMKALLGPLASPLARRYLQRITYLYESALQNFPSSFKLWKSYLQFRMSCVLGKPVIKKRAGGRKKFGPMKDALEEEQDDLEEWDECLDPVIGWEEWKSLIATFERCLMWLPNLPRIWLLYISIFSHPQCPALISHTHTRRTFDRALRTLPPSLHSRIWVRYLLWAESKGGETLVAVYRRYLAIDPTLSERYTALILSKSLGKPRPLEAAKVLLSLARKAARGEYTSPEGKSPLQLLNDFVDVVENYAEDVGMDVEATDESNAAIAKKDAENEGALDAGEPASMDGQLIPHGRERKLNIENIIKKDGLDMYKDQAGRLWVGLATYWIKRGDFDRGRETFEKAIQSVVTQRDFNQIFEAYSQTEDAVINEIMEALEDEEDDDDKAELEEEMDSRMQAFEQLTDRTAFPPERSIETYSSEERPTPNFHRLFINFAKFYEEGGASGQAEPDLDSARKILEKATKVNFKQVEDLAEVWCEWAEMELRHENYDEAIRVMQRATAVPKNTKINYHDHALSAQARLFKSIKLWSFYVDLEESIGTVESTKTVYDKILDLRIANAQIIVNYASFLEENKYFEESFKVYERGVELFTFPVSFEIWNIYLSKFVKRYGGTKVERARDLFEQALEKCPAKSCKPIFLMYAKLEEDYGLAKRAMAIYDRATQVVTDADKFEMFTIYIAKATANFGLPATRPIYERAIEALPDKQTAEMCLRFAALERKLGEIDRARAIYAHASQFCDPRVNQKFWAEWNTFEIETGSEDTFREMLRIRRSVQAQFNTEASYLAAQTIAASEGNKRALSEGPEDTDPMAAAEKQANGGVKGPAFVAAKKTALSKPAEEAGAQPAAKVANSEEIQIEDDEF
ncbi:spliceosome complex protein [Ephemerocybe angulata]|uniref:Pre-mRNA-splicing factor SYF1 n=1 Tax=Ephemerocybe angulata TaxID=980116 RepID=A0A8H6IJI9_9AGAR|nr:spliceosome complex protein [Tulosesus angulatus]